MRCSNIMDWFMLSPSPSFPPSPIFPSLLTSLSLSLSQHMIRYKYLPFSHGKRQYKGRDKAMTTS